MTVQDKKKVNNFGNLPMAVTEEMENGKPLAPLASVANPEAGLRDQYEDRWVNDEYDAICPAFQ